MDRPFHDEATAGGPGEPPRRLSDFIRERKQQILEEWEGEARRLPSARKLDYPALLDHVPLLLDRIAELADDVADGERPSLPTEVAERHAVERLEEGFNLTEVVAEYALLRDCIMRLWEHERMPAGDFAAVRLLNQALDRAVAEAVDRYIQARDRVMRGLEQRLARYPEQVRLLDVLADSTPLLVSYVDPQLRYKFNNRAYEQWFGLSREQIRGKYVREIVGPAAFAQLLPYYQQALAGHAVTCEAEIPYDHGGRRHVEATYTPDLAADGSVRGFVGIVADITARKRAEAELRERELRFRALADNIPQLAWMADSDGSIRWYNQRWFEYTGTSFAELQGWGWQRVHHPEHVERVADRFRRHLETGEVWQDTFPLRGRDGRYRWFLSRAVPIRDDEGRVVRWFGTNTDVTEQRLLADLATVLASSLDHRQTLQQMTELTVSQLADWCVVDLLRREGERERVAAAGGEAPIDTAKVIATGQPELVEELADARHGAVSRAVVPLVARGRMLGAIGVASPAARRRHGQLDLELLQELARRASIAIDNARLYEDAQRAIRSREEILAVVSHDLKNPLSAITLAGALLLLRSEEDARARRQVETINRAASRMEHLISDLLDMASIQAGRLSVQPRPEEADALVGEALDLHEPAAREKGIVILRHCELHGARLLVDRERFLQLCGNLLGNAIKFCSQGDEIVVSGGVRGDLAELSISDTGPGITESELQRVFEPYWSASRHAKQGTGLGLYISKGIVEAHGGRLWVESKPGAGTSFHFTLPLAAAAA